MMRFLILLHCIDAQKVVHYRGHDLVLSFTLSRGGAISPQDSTCIETRLFRSNPLDHHGRVPSYHHYYPMSVWLSSCNLVSQGRAHMPCGYTRSFTTRTSP